MYAWTPGTGVQTTTNSLQSGVGEKQFNYNSYQSTIYEPGAGYVATQPAATYRLADSPDQDSESSAAKGGPRRVGPGSGMDGYDPGQQGGSPIGAPWVMLLFATMYGTWVVFRRRRQSAC